MGSVKFTNRYLLDASRQDACRSNGLMKHYVPVLRRLLIFLRQRNGLIDLTSITRATSQRTGTADVQALLPHRGTGSCRFSPSFIATREPTDGLTPSGASVGRTPAKYSSGPRERARRERFLNRSTNAFFLKVGFREMRRPPPTFSRATPRGITPSFGARLHRPAEAGKDPSPGL